MVQVEAMVVRSEASGLCVGGGFCSDVCQDVAGLSEKLAWSLL